MKNKILLALGLLTCFFMASESVYHLIQNQYPAAEPGECLLFDDTGMKIRIIANDDKSHTSIVAVGDGPYWKVMPVELSYKDLKGFKKVSCE